MSFSFQIGDLVLPPLSALDLTQQYEPLGGDAIFRTASGLGIKQSTWRKTRVVTSGRGWVPDGLDSLDFNQSLVLRCIAPRAHHLPSGLLESVLPMQPRRDSGHRPWGVAWLSPGVSVPVAVTTLGRSVSVQPVAGAIRYSVHYLPELLVWGTRPQQSGDLGSASYRWSLVCEEV